ncbi:hypothetical protein PM082_014879 [Marasmius tenuissimus]|nr:hypothetical protein PM082_014879 [Marasmius tenuissimus]
MPSKFRYHLLKSEDEENAVGDLEDANPTNTSNSRGCSSQLRIRTLITIVAFLMIVTTGRRAITGCNSHQAQSPVTGGDGSTVVLEDGSTFIYSNPHRGHWYHDINDPFNGKSRAQAWTPALNEPFTYGVDRIRGVNLAGWLVLEPFITPALFQPYYPDAIDEYTLSLAIRNAADKGNGETLEKILEEHYKTFITERDFAEIAGAGLNYVRIPLGYWAIDTLSEEEPFLQGVSWKYFLRAIQWARKYGLRINLDLHAVPGSQNGFNHSGKMGTVNLLRGPMGLVNAQRTLDYIRVLAEFISQPQYRDVVTMFSPLNEALPFYMQQDVVEGFYAETYRVIREASGTGPGQGPWITISDGFLGKYKWRDYLRHADRLALDGHPYLAFTGMQSNESWAAKTWFPCRVWGREFNQSMYDFGLTIGGGWSLAVNDCGLWLNGVGKGTRYEGTFPGGGERVGSCERWVNWQEYTVEMKQELKNFAMVNMAGLQNYFFNTWNVGPSRASGNVEAPVWSYKLGLDNGWIPQDPRQANGVCESSSPWSGELSQGSGSNSPKPDLGQYQWPPSSITNAGPIASIYSYTRTGVMPTLTGATFTVSGTHPTKTVDVGSGWNTPEDDRPQRFVEVNGCEYLDPWNVEDAPLPTPWCANLLGKDGLPSPTTPPQ